MPAYLRAPYLLYESQVAALIGPQHRVLELGAGAGGHTLALARTGAHVTATDISSHALTYLARRLADQGLTVLTRVADMEALPFAENAFDFVACAGSLSYGDPALVDAEIRRVLRPGGCLICVDSLNHNPVYRLNRLIHCYRGNRTKSTLKRMPDLTRIEQISRPFRTVEVRYFGALSFAMPVLARVLGTVRAEQFSDWMDRTARIRRSAFKFVLIARSLEKS
ncbi:MAG: class I SAM-dependent methyltransferase [Burkholderiaceae bacterium]